MLRNVKMERAILVLLRQDDGLRDQVAPIAKPVPATVYTCIGFIEGVNERIANLLASSPAFPSVCWQAHAQLHRGIRN